MGLCERPLPHNKGYSTVNILTRSALLLGWDMRWHQCRWKRGCWSQFKDPSSAGHGLLLRNSQCVGFVTHPDRAFAFPFHNRWQCCCLLNSLQAYREMTLFQCVDHKRRNRLPRALQQQFWSASNQTHVLSFIMAHDYETPKQCARVVHISVVRLGFNLNG